MEISIRNEVPFRKVITPYIQSNRRVYSGDLKGIEKADYSQELDEKAFRLTERFLDYKKTMDLNKLK